MIKTTQYRFCDDIWNEIKSYVIQPVTRCACCANKPTKYFPSINHQLTIQYKGNTLMSNDTNYEGRLLPLKSIKYSFYEDNNINPITESGDVKINYKKENQGKWVCDVCYLDFVDGLDKWNLPLYDKVKLQIRQEHADWNKDKVSNAVDRKIDEIFGVQELRADSLLIKYNRLQKTRQQVETYWGWIFESVEQRFKITQQNYNRRYNELVKDLADRTKYSILAVQEKRMAKIPTEIVLRLAVKLFNNKKISLVVLQKTFDEVTHTSRTRTLQYIWSNLNDL